MEEYGLCWITEKWKNKVGLVEKNTEVSPRCLSQILVISKNDFMKIYSIRNRRKKERKKSIAVTKR